jgi:hypothetical protein
LALDVVDAPSVPVTWTIYVEPVVSGLAPWAPWGAKVNCATLLIGREIVPALISVPTITAEPVTMLFADSVPDAEFNVDDAVKLSELSVPGVLVYALVEHDPTEIGPAPNALAERDPVPEQVAATVTVTDEPPVLVNVTEVTVKLVAV